MSHPIRHVFRSLLIIGCLFAASLATLNPAGLPGGSFGFSLGGTSWKDPIRFLSEKPKEPRGEPAGLECRGSFGVARSRTILGASPRDSIGFQHTTPQVTLLAFAQNTV